MDNKKELPENYDNWPENYDKWPENYDKWSENDAPMKQLILWYQAQLAFFGKIKALEYYLLTI